MIVGLVIGLVLLVGGGVTTGVVFFSEPKDIEVFPASYDRTVDAASAGRYTYRDDTDYCSMMDWSVLSYMHFDGEQPELTTSDPAGDGTGWFTCKVTLRSNEGYNEYSATGGIIMSLGVESDEAAAAEVWAGEISKAEDLYTEITVEGIGTSTRAFFDETEKSQELRVYVQDGNLSGYVYLSFNHGTHFAAAASDLMINTVADLTNGMMLQMV
ncbi:hypothetical protein ACFQ3B_10105 [Stackebrandtia endophytica]|uniref:hypothetical protein n=1 Tax=Stackebrandtia endophytica TaxID=1496996 RepID=UPI001154B53C|nr:hypothetical protein [Stackebrandtia endophytica]